jgi:hypothetical protein
MNLLSPFTFLVFQEVFLPKICTYLFLLFSILATCSVHRRIPGFIILTLLAFFPAALQSLKDLGRLTYRRFLELFRQTIGLLARVISPSQGLYLHRTTQHRKTRTTIHALSGIRTHDPSNQPAKTHASDCTATVTGTLPGDLYKLRNSSMCNKYPTHFIFLRFKYFPEHFFFKL